MTWLDECTDLTTATQRAQKQAESTRQQLTAAVQRHMDQKAQERTYDHILSLCTYATDLDPVLAAEGQAGVEWRSAVWRHCYVALNDVLAGNRAIPTEAELLAELPTFEWPTPDAGV